MKCQYTSCTGTLDDGFCDVCGRPPAGAGTHITASTGSDYNSSTSGSTNGQNMSSRGSSSRSRSAHARSTTSRRRAGLGAGLLELPPLPPVDPLQAVLADPRVPERKRVCPALVYRAPGGDVLQQAEARERGFAPEALEDCATKLAYDEGFCPSCGQAYSFRPSLAAGAVVDRKYEVKGPIAFGGLGWIYLAWAKHLARWVIIKGLLNIKDETQRELARAEARSLSAVKHPNIVQVYDLIEGDQARNEPDYIVMEYVGGQTLMTLRKESGKPLPVAEACAYMLGILPAFGYLHQMGRVYMDFKPENVMLEPPSANTGENGRVVLIDMGAVHAAFDDTGALYATTGYSSPESAPTPQHDLYTVGRTLAVLTADFKYGSSYQQRLPAAREVAEWAAHPSFYRFLEKATRQDPDYRFQTATEAEEQLRGILRLLVAETAAVPPAESTLYSGDVQELLGTGTDRVTGRGLPITRTNASDPAAGLIEAANRERDLARRLAMLRGGLSQPQFAQSVDLPLETAGTLVEAGDFAAAEGQLAQVEGDDPFEWRVQWLRGRIRLAEGKPAEARRLFEQVDAEVPGELAPKLALAMAAEADGDVHSAAVLYDTASRTDPSFTTATFGLARCRSRLNDRPGAVAAYARVPSTSSRYVAAQLAMARTMCDPALGPVHVDDVVRASEILGNLQHSADGRDLHMVAADVFLAVVGEVEAGRLSPNGTRVFGRACHPSDLRRGAEESLRRCARYAASVDERIALVDRANAVRPRTLF
ncbi:MAG TPA: tetratricopeptide repeat protein [Chloroflexota bacterium]|nr:tetratricopeptide repeat protein [Chloroflexota bacterium]